MPTNRIPRRALLAAAGVAVAALLAIFVIAPRLGSHQAVHSRPRISSENAEFWLYGASKDLPSAQQVIREAKAAAVFKPSSASRIEMVHGNPVTLTTVTVTQTVTGRLPHTLILRQPGTAGDGHSAVVSPAGTYLAYLKPFELHPGHPVAGQYILVDNHQGLLEQDKGETTHAAAGGYSDTFTATTNGPVAGLSAVTLTFPGN
jgi:hypothetical protein